MYPASFTNEFCTISCSWGANFFKPPFLEHRHYSLFDSCLSCVSIYLSVGGVDAIVIILLFGFLELAIIGLLVCWTSSFVGSEFFLISEGGYSASQRCHSSHVSHVSSLRSRAHRDFTSIVHQGRVHDVLWHGLVSTIWPSSPR